ncbi:MAG TPA: hypothetical protein VFM70_07245 [Salinimicrobium sp.]|nr:hypothetical protein [Salinimicrobium sp.]
MKNTKTLQFIFIILVAVVFVGCSNKIVFPNSEVIPAAEAVLKVEENKNNNYEINLEVEKMAKPDRLTPPRKTYVVWMISEKNGTINLGNLKVSDKNKATLQTVSPYKPIKVFITAEDTKSITVPSTQVVLSTKQFKVK